MRSWLDRARATAPKRAIKRASSDLPTLENLDAHDDYLRSLLAEDPSLRWFKLNEAMKTRGFLVEQSALQSWLDRYHRKCQRAFLKGPIEGLPVVDREGLLPYETQLLEFLDSNPDTTYTQLKELLEQKLGATCTKITMQRWKQAPFRSLPMVSIHELSSAEHINFLKAVYSATPDIHDHDLRVKLANRFKVTASDDTMSLFSMLRQPIVGKRLHNKTPPADAAVTSYNSLFGQAV